MFKPDKRLRWFSHLGSILLEILSRDRTASTDVQPLGATYIELFSEQASSLLDVRTVDDPIVRVGTVERSAALKFLFAWVDRGVLREETENRDVQCFCLLEHVPEDVGSAPMTTAGSRTALTDEVPAVSGRIQLVRVCWCSLRGGN